MGRRAVDGESVDADLVRLYLGDISRHRLLSHADEQRLGAMMATGRAASELIGSGPTEEKRQDLAAAVAAGADARQQFIESNLRLVVALARWPSAIRVRARRCLISFRTATWGCYALSTGSIIARASSSRHTPRGGSARRLCEERP